jgi:hypothetical protein
VSRWPVAAARSAQQCPNAIARGRSEPGSRSARRGRW